MSNYAANSDRYWTANTSNIYTNSNVGIGTSTPSYKLDVVGTGKFSSNLTLNQVWLSDKGLYLRTGADSNHGLIYNSTADGARLFGYSGGVLSANGGSNALYWKRDGKIGIGNAISNPSYPLDVSGIANATTLYENSTSLITKYSLSNNNSNWDYGSNTASFTSNAFYNNMAASWQIYSGALYTTSNVGIGTSMPLTRFQINTDTASGGGLLIFGSSNNRTALKVSSSGAGWGSGIIFENTTASTGKSYGIYASSGGGLEFANVSTSSAFMSVNSNGSVNVSGALWANSNIKAKHKVIVTPDVNQSYYGWAMNTTTTSNVGFVFAEDNTYLQGPSDSSSNVLTILKNGGILTQGNIYSSNGDLVLQNRGQTLYIQPGLKESTTTSGYTQYEMGGSCIHYFWDTLQATGDIYGANKYFCIPHPCDSNQVLFHSCVEAPQADLMYSGSVKLKNGGAIVSIDEASCPQSPMLKGTFEALTRNARVYLQNNETWDKVRGKVRGGDLIIECENNTCDADINFLIIAERKDESVLNSKVTDNKGHLKTQHKRADWLIDDEGRPSRRKNKDK